MKYGPVNEGDIVMKVILLGYPHMISINVNARLR